MVRGLLGIAAVLGLLLVWQFDRAESLAEDNAQYQYLVDHVVAENGKQAEVIDSLSVERNRLQHSMGEYVARRDRAIAARAESDRKLSELAGEYESLREYLSVAVPWGVAEWLWVKSSQSDYQGGTLEASPSRSSIEGYARAGYAAVSHEDGWRWCRDVEAALSSCNADKQAIREWLE